MYHIYYSNDENQLISIRYLLVYLTKENVSFKEYINSCIQCYTKQINLINITLI